MLITEQGGVQLCDFGVAGIVEGRKDKRSTIIGTPHWMAPELFNSSNPYGKEVDIWAFGCMVYEMATGYPPNATTVAQADLADYLRSHAPPRLEGGDYSDELRNLVAYCLEEDPESRPTIEEVQNHKYIYGTANNYPTSSLRSLVGSFRVWESRGGVRKSLFFQHGASAQAPSISTTPPNDVEWNFSTTEVFEEGYQEEFSTQDVYDAYGPSVVDFDEDTARVNNLAAKPTRRQPPPKALARLPGPLEKVFDTNTLTNYEENSRVHYGRQMQPPSTSDLPLRDDSAHISIRDTMIDLGGHDAETGISSFADMDTIKPTRSYQADGDGDRTSIAHDFSRPALSDPADINNNRRTQDWKFPSFPPASADPELSRFPTSYEVPLPSVTPGSGARPTLIHHPTEPLSAFSSGASLNPGPAAPDRLSMRESLIDLDMSLPDPIPNFRPSTANSDVGSTTSEQMTSGNPFELERHASLYQPAQIGGGREPSIYVSEETLVSNQLRSGNALQEIVDMSDFSASDAEGTYGNDYQDDQFYLTGTTLQNNGSMENMPRMVQYDSADGYEPAEPPIYNPMPPPPLPMPDMSGPSLGDLRTRLPELIDHPTRKSLIGDASHEDMKEEITRMLSGMNAQLEAFRDIYDSQDVVQKRGSGLSLRRQQKEEMGADQ